MEWIVTKAGVTGGEVVLQGGAPGKEVANHMYRGGKDLAP